jgi:polysaccharide export outer membrane protein
MVSVTTVCAENIQYLLGDGDVVKITVYDHVDLETTVRINSNGTFLFPLIGEVDVDGKTVSQVSEKLAAMLADGYIINPQVTVFIEEFRSKKAIIMGQIEKPGLYELRGSTTLLELISKAGGLKKEAGTKVMIKRNIAGAKGAKGAVVTVDLTKLIEEGDTSLDVPIWDKDNVFVSKSGTFFVTGEVEKPDVYNFEPGTTVIKAITLAGGFTPIASQGKVRLIRVIDGVESLLEKAPMHTLIMPDDVIVVPESFF